MREVGIGLVGSGFMGKCHANAFRAVSGIFDLPVTPRLELLADVSDEKAQAAANAFGFRRATSDWRLLVQDPAIDIVAITAPNRLHKDISLAALDAGKAVYCEKPLSIDAPSAKAMRDAAVEAGACTMVGFNFLKNPMIALAKSMIDAGELGDIIGFRGIHAENYMGEDAPHTFRTDPDGGGGALADLGSHIISLGVYLLGSLDTVCGDASTIVKDRWTTDERRERTASRVDDRTVFMGRFSNGPTGTFEAFWFATGRTMQLQFEITGTKGALAFTQERMNELLVFRGTGNADQQGFTRIEAGPAHPPYGLFCPAPGHQLGFNELKIIEVAALLNAYANGQPGYPDFDHAYEVQCVVDTVIRSSQNRRWERVNAT